MKAYVINLDKNIDRMVFMKSQLNRLGVEYERFSAVNGKELTKQQRRGGFSAFRSFLAMGIRLTDGEIGCALSHAMIYRKMQDKEIPIALILEDDVLLADCFCNVLEKAVAGFIDCNKPQVILLSSHACCQKHEDGIERITSGMCTDGYLITLPAARMLYKANYPVITVADRWHRWVKRLGLELYRIWPTVVQQNNNQFGTDVNTVQRIQKNVVFRFFQKLIRLPELIIDWTLFVFTRR